MPRPRKGSLELRPNGWHARLTADVVQPNGSCVSERRWVPLGTNDKARARRLMDKLVREIDAGRLVADAKDVVEKPDTVRDYAKSWCDRREAQGIRMVPDERSYLARNILPHIGTMALAEVRPTNIRHVLDDGVRAGYSRETVSHLRRLMSRLFKTAWQDEIIQENPVARVQMPAVRHVRKERVILTDEEIAKLMACSEVNAELKVLSIVARVEGGMRTGDLNKWDWTMIDLLHFEQCTIPRSKTGTPQVLEIPLMLRDILRGWWEMQDTPASGPVFPICKGANKGGFRAERGVTYAKRLRKALFAAGVVRMPPIEVPATSPGTRTDRGKQAKGTKLAPNPADPLYFETATTRQVDFHSFRRAFNTALAEAGVNVQTAMHLASHSDAKTHMRYVMKTAAMMRIPEAALPRINGTNVAVLARHVDNSNWVSKKSSMISARPGGLEPPTHGLEGEIHSPISKQLRDIDSVGWVQKALAVSPCFIGIRNDLAPRAKTNLDKSMSIEWDSESIIEHRVLSAPSYEVWPEWPD